MAYNAEEISARLLRGEPVSFSPDQPEEERQVPAAMLAAAARAGKRVQLENAVVTGPLDLSYAEVRERFLLVNVRFEDPVDLSFAHFHCGIECHEVRFGRTAEFDGAVFEKRAKFSGSEFVEGASFIGIAIIGQATFNGARFAKQVRFDGAKITGALFFRPEDGHPAEFEGEARFHGVQVGGQATFNGARFHGKVRFDGAKITGGFFFRPEDGHRAEFKGEAGFHGVEVGGQANFRGARFGGEARFDGAQIRGSLFFRPLAGHRAEFADGAVFNVVKVAGQADFSGARFGGPAYFEGAAFSGNVYFDQACFTGESVSFLSARFSLVVRFRETDFSCPVQFNHAVFLQQVYFSRTKFGRNISLRECSLTTLSFVGGDEAATFAPDVRVDLTGCTYNLIEVPDWRDLMHRLGPPASQPWGQLIRALRAAGEEREAREAYYAWRESEGNRVRLREQPGRYVIDRFERWVADYGVRSRYVLAWILLILGLGTFIFSLPGALQTTKDYPPEFWSGLAGPFYAPAVDGLAASFRVFMPVEVYVGRKWEPKHGLYSGYAAFHTLMGWILIPVVVASLTGLLRREPPA